MRRPRMTRGRAAVPLEPITFARAPYASKDWALVEQLEALARFVPVFASPTFEFSEFVPGEKKEEAVTLGHYRLAPEAQAFIETAHTYGWVRDFPWSEWQQTAEAARLRDDPDALSQATPTDLAKLLTACCRAERFVEGSLSDHYQSGLLRRVVERAKTLLRETRDVGRNGSI